MSSLCVPQSCADRGWEAVSRSGPGAGVEAGVVAGSQSLLRPSCQACRHRASVDVGSLHPEPGFMVWGTRLYHLQDPPLSESLPLSEPAFIFVPNAPVFMGLCQVRQSRARSCVPVSQSYQDWDWSGWGRPEARSPVGAARPSPLHPSSRAESSDQAGKSDCPPNRVRQPDRMARCRQNPPLPVPQKFFVVARAPSHVSGNRARPRLGIGSDTPDPAFAPPSRVNAAPDPAPTPIARPDPSRFGGRHGLNGHQMASDHPLAAPRTASTRPSVVSAGCPAPPRMPVTASAARLRARTRLPPPSPLGLSPTRRRGSYAAQRAARNVDAHPRRPDPPTRADPAGTVTADRPTRDAPDRADRLNPLAAPQARPRPRGGRPAAGRIAAIRGR